MARKEVIYYVLINRIRKVVAETSTNRFELETMLTNLQRRSPVTALEWDIERNSTTQEVSEKKSKNKKDDDFDGF